MAGGGGARARAGGVGTGLAIRGSLPAAPAAADPLPEQTAGTDRNTSLRSPHLLLLLLLSSRRRCRRLPPSRPAPPLRRRGGWVRLCAAAARDGRSLFAHAQCARSPAEFRASERAQSPRRPPGEPSRFAGLTEERRRPASGLRPGSQRWAEVASEHHDPGLRPPGGTVAVPDSDPWGAPWSPARLSAPSASVSRGAVPPYTPWNQPHVFPVRAEAHLPVHVCCHCRPPCKSAGIAPSLCFWLFPDKFSGSPGWHLTFRVAEDNHKLRILPVPPESGFTWC